MKAFLVVCLAAAAMAESDPQLLLNTPYMASPFVRPLTYVKPVEYKTVQYKTPVEYKTVEYKTPVEYKTFEYKPVEYKPVEYKKVEIKPETYKFEKSAEEKKFEVPALSYKTPVVGAVPTAYAAHPFVGGMSPIAYASAVVGQQETIVPAKYHAKSEEVEHTVFKRSADADAEAFFAVHGYYPTTYTTPFAARTVYNTAAIKPAYYNTVYNHAVASPIASHIASPVAYMRGAYPSEMMPVDADTKTYANDAIKPQQYAAKGRYFAESAGVTHVAKRDAEADPLVYYNNAFGYNYPATVYGSNVVRPLAYNTAYTHSYPYNTLGYRWY